MKVPFAELEGLEEMEAVDEATYEATVFPAAEQVLAKADSATATLLPQRLAIACWTW